MLFNSTPIQMEWFYNIHGDRSKFNWFLLEIALEYYDRIKDSPDLFSYRKMYNESQIAQFCTYYARRSKEGLLKNLRGQRKNIILYQEHIYDFYPHHTKQMNAALSKVGDEAWKHMLEACAICPQQCLVDYESRSPEFDFYKD